MRRDLFLTALLLIAGPGLASGQGLILLADITTVEDGRASIHQLFSAYASLLERGWQLDVITHSRPAGTHHAIPVIALRLPQSGPATWIISGIHGEEPAGPNAIAGTINEIAGFGESRPVVLIPLANPHGYVRNWRYLNVPLWSEDVEVQSVGDSSHLLPDPESLQQSRAELPANAEADAITEYVLDKMSDYLPLVSIDLHEDDKINAGYVYSQGTDGASDPLASEAISVLFDNGIPIKIGGYTRFEEVISNGIVGPVVDGSIDELMSAKAIIVDGVPQAGPAARTVLVFETPADSLPLSRRQEAHQAVLRRLIQLISAADD